MRVGDIQGQTAVNISFHFKIRFLVFNFLSAEVKIFLPLGMVMTFDHWFFHRNWDKLATNIVRRYWCLGCWPLEWGDHRLVGIVVRYINIYFCNTSWQFWNTLKPRTIRNKQQIFWWCMGIWVAGHLSGGDHVCNGGGTIAQWGKHTSVCNRGGTTVGRHT